MRTSIIVAAIALSLAGCKGRGDDRESSKETPLEVASRPFTIGNSVGNQMGDTVGEMGRDQEGDPALNALAEAPDDAMAVGTESAQATVAPEEAGNSQFTTEGGPEG